MSFTYLSYHLVALAIRFVFVVCVMLRKGEEGVKGRGKGGGWGSEVRRGVGGRGEGEGEEEGKGWGRGGGGEGRVMRVRRG